MTTDRNVQNLIINDLTKAQYESITNPSSTELYLTPDESITASDLKTVNNNSLVGSGNINVGTVTSVNNVQPVNGNVTLSIPQQVQANWNEADTTSKAYIQNKPTIPAVYITETYYNEGSWYRVWSNGWWEQGGIITSVSSAGDSFQVALIKRPTISDKYFVGVTNIGSATSTSNTNGRTIARMIGQVVSKNNMSFYIQVNKDHTYVWYACGY